MKLFPGIPTPITKTSTRSSTLFAALVLPLFLTLLGTSVAQPVQHGAEAADNDDVASSAYWKRAGFVGMRDGVQNAGMRAGKLVRAYVAGAGRCLGRASRGNLGRCFSLPILNSDPHSRGKKSGWPEDGDPIMSEKRAGFQGE